MPIHQKWNYIKVGVTSIKLDIHNALEEKTDMCFSISDEMPATFIHLYSFLSFFTSNTFYSERPFYTRILLIFYILYLHNFMTYVNE